MNPLFTQALAEVTKHHGVQARRLLEKAIQQVTELSQKPPPRTQTSAPTNQPQWKMLTPTEKELMLRRDKARRIGLDKVADEQFRKSMVAVFTEIGVTEATAAELVSTFYLPKAAAA